MYDFMEAYTAEYFRTLTPRELQVLFEEAKGVSFIIQGIKQIKKVTNDIAVMRNLLNGFDGIYNEKHST